MLKVRVRTVAGVVSYEFTDNKGGLKVVTQVDLEDFLKEFLGTDAVGKSILLNYMEKGASNGDDSTVLSAYEYNVLLLFIFTIMLKIKDMAGYAPKITTDKNIAFYSQNLGMGSDVFMLYMILSTIKENRSIVVSPYLHLNIKKAVNVDFTFINILKNIFTLRVTDYKQSFTNKSCEKYEIPLSALLSLSVRLLATLKVGTSVNIIDELMLERDLMLNKVLNIEKLKQLENLFN